MVLLLAHFLTTCCIMVLDEEIEIKYTYRHGIVYCIADMVQHAHHNNKIQNAKE